MQPTPIHGGPALAEGLPFLLMLLSIALFPMFAPRFWHRHMGKVALFWSLASLVPLSITEGTVVALLGAWQAILGEYFPFVALLVAMYSVGGGILLEGGPWGTPRGNTVLMTIAIICGAIIGPVAVSMVLIHPLLRANAHRRDKVHLVVFFIVLVCNVSGVTTPLGNPPLYIGLLQGVPFDWPLRMLLLPGLVLTIPLLALFWWFDRRSAAKDPVPAARRRLHFRGIGNVALLALVFPVGPVQMPGAMVGGGQFSGAMLFLAVAAVAGRKTPLAIHQANMFTWEPMVEVAKLFAGIFVTIVPVLHMLEAGTAGPLAPLLRLTANAAGQPVPAVYFWFAGILSAFLDNAPTYLLFFRLAGGDPARLTGEWAPTLMAMSAGAVCFGALTYIGNAPNMMVRGVAAHRGVRMPGFFGYMAMACGLLLPGFVLLTVLFFL
ncbi:MAG: sodium:proton antiporter [Alphaproteobacteria bacterium]|nr:sodium:proton antiporter [Alphaproteobacteria bacterium]